MDRIGVAVSQDYALMIPRGAGGGGPCAAGFYAVPARSGGAAPALLIAPLLDDSDDALSETTLRSIGLSPALLVAMDRQRRDGFMRR